MGFDDEQKGEIATLIRSELGLEEGQTLAEVLSSSTSEAINAAINKYDKRKTKEFSTFVESEFGPLKERLEQDPPKDPPDPNNPPKPGEIDISKLPPEVRHQLTELNQRTKTMEQQLKEERDARETERAEREKLEAERADAARRDAIRNLALDKDRLGFQFDAAMLPILIEHLDGRVKPVEGKPGEYVYDTGEIDDISREPVLKPLVDGLKAFGASDVGKRFRPAVPGATPPPPGGATSQAGKRTEAEIAEGLANGTLKPSAVEEMIRKGEVSTSQ